MIDGETLSIIQDEMGFLAAASTSSYLQRVLDTSSNATTSPPDINLDLPTLVPTSSPVSLVTSTDSTIIRNTLRVYGTVYLACFLAFCFLRQRFNKYYNIRSWVPEMKCNLAVTQTYGFFSWCWKVFYVSDDELLDQIGMDSLCFVRCLRLGTKLSFFGVLQSIWLLPLYYTAPQSAQTSYLQDVFVLLSVANLPGASGRFTGTVLAAYLICFYSLYLISKEYDWFIEYRHKYLSQRVPRNYAVYVSGIPNEFRSSYKLADYFRKSSGAQSVFEAHITMEIPKLEAKVARREVVLQKLEHAMALEKLKGKTKTHRTFRKQRRNSRVVLGGRFEKVETVQQYKAELDQLNNEISLEIGRILNSNHRLRHNLRKSVAMHSLRNGLGNLTGLDSDEFDVEEKKGDDHAEGKSGHLTFEDLVKPHQLSKLRQLHPIPELPASVESPSPAAENNPGHPSNGVKDDTVDMIPLPKMHPTTNHFGMLESRVTGNTRLNDSSEPDHATPIRYPHSILKSGRNQHSSDRTSTNVASVEANFDNRPDIAETDLQNAHPNGDDILSTILDPLSPLLGIPLHLLDFERGGLFPLDWYSLRASHLVSLLGPSSLSVKGLDRTAVSHGQCS